MSKKGTSYDVKTTLVYQTFKLAFGKSLCSQMVFVTYDEYESRQSDTLFEKIKFKTHV